MKQIIAVCVTALLAACASAPEAATVEPVESKFSAEHAELYIQAETAHLKTNNNKKARALLEQLLASDLSGYERLATLQLLAGIKIAQSDFSGAIEALETVSELDTSITDERRLKLQYNIGQLHLQVHSDSDDLKDIEAGIAAFEKFEALGGELNRDDLWRNAIMYEEVGRINEAIPLVEQLYKESTDSDTKIEQGEFLSYLYHSVERYDEVRDMSKALWNMTGDERAIVSAVGAMNSAGWDQESLDWCRDTSEAAEFSRITTIALLRCQSAASKALDLPTEAYDSHLCEEFGHGCVEQ